MQALLFKINAVKPINEKGAIIFKNKEIANIFNEYFGSIVESLDLHIWTEGSSNVPLSHRSDDVIDDN